MYLPHHFTQTDTATLVAFMRQYAFATIVSEVDGKPCASHLPFVVEWKEDGTIQLLAHFAKANPQWQTLEGQTALVIFNEPHAYISPSLYDKELSVPTWNYIAVHAYGHATLITEEAAVRELLEKQIQSFEKEYFTQWMNLPEPFKAAMQKGLTAFRIDVTELQGKEKLSQNKSAQERERIGKHLIENTDSTARETGLQMLNKLLITPITDN
ncbi:MAG: FMN-binding negative transcriptional regulator [Bacteroidetes bacterium]|nr:FMN-binding negative transcriptional regulator [Bacteroidota bacterium]